MKKVISAFVLSIALFGVANAQVWSLEKCISYAMENNLSIKQTKVGVDLAVIDKADARFAMYPNLNSQASNTHTYGRAINPLTNSYVPQDVNSVNLNANTNVTLFNGFQRINNFKSSEMNVEAEKKSLEKIKNDIALNVINNYLNVLFNQELLIVAKEQLEVTKLQLDRAQKNAAVGNATEGDVLNIKSQVANDELSVTNAENNLVIARLNLIQLLDRDPGEVFEVEKPGNIDQYLVVSNVASLKEVYENASNNLPDIKLLEYRYKAAQRSLASAKGAYYPRLTLGAGLSSDYADLNPTSFNNQMKNNFGQFYQFSLSIPIFNGFSARNNVKRANLQLQNAEINKQNAELTLGKTVQQAIADLSAARKKYESTYRSNESLKEAFTYSQRRFDVGLINAIDYNIAKNSLAKSAADLVQAKYELLFRAKLLDFYNGKALTF